MKISKFTVFGADLLKISTVKVHETVWYITGGYALQSWPEISHWHTTLSGKYIKIFEKTQYLMNTLYYNLKCEFPIWALTCVCWSVGGPVIKYQEGGKLHFLAPIEALII